MQSQRFSSDLADTMIKMPRSHTSHRATGHVIDGKFQTKCGQMLEGKVYGGTVATPSNCKDCGPAWNQHDVVAYAYQDADPLGEGKWYGYASKRGSVIKNFGPADSQAEITKKIAEYYPDAPVKIVADEEVA